MVEMQLDLRGGPSTPNYLQERKFELISTPIFVAQEDNDNMWQIWLVLGCILIVHFIEWMNGMLSSKNKTKKSSKSYINDHGW